MLQSSGFGASLGYYKVVVWVWATTKWRFGREFGLLQSGGLAGREFELLQSGGLGASLGCYKVVV